MAGLLSFLVERQLSLPQIYAGRRRGLAAAVASSGGGQKASGGAGGASAGVAVRQGLARPPHNAVRLLFLPLLPAVSPPLLPRDATRWSFSLCLHQA
uniref:Uncharacterized protein n=1 Tax=Arundo donax TaxID=35708 RepID=A0A0A9B979_ARUDO